MGIGAGRGFVRHDEAGLRFGGVDERGRAVVDEDLRFGEDVGEEAVGVQLRGVPKPRPEPADEDLSQTSATAPYWPTVLALQAAYVFGIYFLGFTVATLSYLVVAPLQMRYRRWLIIAAEAALLTLVVAGSFTWFFHVRLPKGTLWSLF